MRQDCSDGSHLSFINVKAVARYEININKNHAQYVYTIYVALKIV